jgi:1-acyl-sn-glycerol-3-phosphate acyltransferase
MCKHNVGAVSTIRWFQGMFCASIISFTYMFSPLYIVTSFLFLIWGYPSPDLSLVYAMPMIISILVPSMASPKIVSYLAPMCDYFQFNAIEEDGESIEKDLAKGKNYIIAIQPHGVISYGGICSAIAFDRKYSKVKTAVASVVLKIPILKHVMGIFNLTDASASNLKRILHKDGEEGSIVLYVGGMAELFYCSRDIEKLYLSKRKGFIKLALRSGVDIIPIYMFGNTSVLSVLTHGILADISRKLKLSTTLFWGKWYLPIPRDDKILYVSGKPISIPHIAEPTSEDVDKYHAIYVKEVERIFETYKKRVPLYQNKKLVID